MTSNRGRGASAESRFEPTTVIGLLRPLAWAFSAAALAAFGLMSRATTLAAPARAAARARIPDPVPTSATRLPAKSISERKFAKNLLERKYRGWNTVGRTERRKPATRAILVLRRRRVHS